MIALAWCSAAIAAPSATWDFEEGLNGFSVETALQWEWGAFPTSDRPDGAGEYGWSTQLGDSHRNDATDGIVLEDFTIDGMERPVLSLEHWYAIDPSSLGDAGWLEVEMDGEWTTVEPVYGYPSSVGFNGFSDRPAVDWFDLTGADAHTKIRFVFSADLAVSLPGWSIDAVSLFDGDPVPPLFIHATNQADTTTLNTPLTIETTVIDDVGVETVTLWWSVNDTPPTHEAMNPTGENTYSAAIDGQPSGTDIAWWITASDGTNIAVYPPEEKNRFRVSLPAPTDLQSTLLANTQRIAAQQLPVKWTPPNGDYSLLRYELMRNGTLLLTSDTETATVPLVDGDQTLTVRGVFATETGPARGDSSAPLILTVAYPFAHPPEPDSAWPGDRIRIEITGENLHLTESVELIATPGASTSDFTVWDANLATAIIAIDDDFSADSIDLTLQSEAGTIPLSGPLHVMGDGERPSISAVRPNVVRQGAKATVFVDINESLNADMESISVGFGTGIFVEEIRARATGFDVDIAVDPSAPLGVRSVTVDTGNRILTGSSLSVRDGKSTASSNCSSTGTTDTGAWLAFVALLARGRRRPQDSHMQPLPHGAVRAQMQ